VQGFHFLGSHGRQMASPFVGFQQNFVGQNIELFLHFALHIFAVKAAQNAA
jgi:hypothetical protein